MGLRTDFSVKKLDSKSSGCDIKQDNQSPDTIKVCDNGIGRQQYDLEFVTFLRHMLSLGKGEEGEGGMVISWTRAKAPAEWIDQEQGIFRINSREEFATGW